MPRSAASRPRWDRLYAAAAAQEGCFTSSQAAESGYSPQLLAHYLGIGRIARVYRGIYRLVQFPPGEHEDLLAIWLWSDRKGVFSHETALALHDLSDVLSSKIHLTLPAAWETRRLRFPPGVVAHYAGVPASERSWAGSLPLTSPSRTVRDCAQDQVQPDLVHQALEEGLSRGLFPVEGVPDALAYVRAFGLQGAA